MDSCRDLENETSSQCVHRGSGEGRTKGKRSGLTIAGAPGLPRMLDCQLCPCFRSSDATPPPKGKQERVNTYQPCSAWSGRGQECRPLVQLPGGPCEETWSAVVPVLYQTPTFIVPPRMAPKTFADRPINKLVLFDVDGTLTPARQVDIEFPSGSIVYFVNH